MISFNKENIFWGEGKWYLLIVLLAFSQSSAIAQNMKPIQKIRIDPEAADSGKVSQYIDAVSFIPLETTKDSEFSNIVQLEMNDDYYIILDDRVPAILIFTDRGYFIKESIPGKLSINSLLIKRKTRLSFKITQKRLLMTWMVI